MIVIGIDPGLDGGLALVHHATNTCIVSAMPTRDHFSGKGREVDAIEVQLLLTKWRQQVRSSELELGLPVASPTLVVIEHVTGAKIQGRNQGGMSMFSFGEGFGMVRVAVVLLHLPHIYVRPQRWQKLVLTGKLSPGDTKKRALSFASRRFPSVSLLKNDRCKVPHGGIVDALCIAEYGATYGSKEPDSPG